MNAITVISVIMALAATVLAFLFIVPEDKRKKLNKIGKLAHDICNFKFLIIEKILQALYIFCTALVVVFGFILLFYFEKQYSYLGSSRVQWYGGWGLLIMILGPIAIRLVYEGMMMAILLVKNVIQINNKIKVSDDAKGEEKEDIFGVNLPFSAPAEEPAPVAEPSVAPVAPYSEPAAPVVPVAPAAPAFCSKCGAKAGDGIFCSVCGNKL